MDLKEVIKFEGLSDYKNILKISIVLIFLLMIIDSKNIINHIFALVNIVAISYIFKDNKEKYF